MPVLRRAARRRRAERGPTTTAAAAASPPTRTAAATSPWYNLRRRSATADVGRRRPRSRRFSVQLSLPLTTYTYYADGLPHAHAPVPTGGRSTTWTWPSRPAPSSSPRPCRRSLTRTTGSATRRASPPSPTDIPWGRGPTTLHDPAQETSRPGPQVTRSPAHRHHVRVTTRWAASRRRPISLAATAPPNTRLGAVPRAFDTLGRVLAPSGTPTGPTSWQPTGTDGGGAGSALPGLRRTRN